LTPPWKPLPDLVRLLDLVQPHLAQDARRRDVGLLEVAGARLGHVLLHGLEAELQRVVAVGRLAPDLDDRARPRLDHRDRHVVAIVTEDLGHADLAADQRFLPGHVSDSSNSPRADQKRPDTNPRIAASSAGFARAISGEASEGAVEGPSDETLQMGRFHRFARV
jgi:hypothetical protein